jgi:hypothetical protein
MTQKYGLAVDNNLSDVEDNVQALRQLGFEPSDLFILQNTGASGVTATDYANISGLTFHLEAQVVGALNRASGVVNSQSLYVANSGDVSVGSIYADTVNSDRGYADLNNAIYATSSGSYFSTTNPSGNYGQGGQYKLGPVRATTLTAAGAAFDNSTVTDWSSRYVKYKQYLVLKTEDGTTDQYVPTYLAPPTVMQGNALWFDSEFSTFTVDGSNKVSEWQDVLGRGTLAQTTSASQPTYTTNLLNGKPGVVFAGSQSLTMPELHPLVPQAATVVTIFRTADTSYNILGTTNSTSNRWRDTDGNGNLGLFTRAIEADFPLGMPAIGNYYSSIRISQTYGLEFRLNSYAIDYEPGSGFTYDATGEFIVGRSVSTAGAFTGDIYAICIFDRILTDQELATIEEYFAWRYDFVYDPSRTQTLELEAGGDIQDEFDNAFVFG